MTPIHNVRIGLIANIADKVVRLSPATALRFASAFLIILGTLQPGFARQRGPRVEVVCPSQPIPVRQGEQQVLVYALHITNFDLVPLTLKRLEIFADEDNSQPLKAFSDDALSATMVQAASMGGAKDSRTIDPGSRAVVFLWIGLRLDQPAPSSLRHRLVFVAGG